ncbi:LysR substrate-binding domain-containing protein [Uliginosibacterium aquaticum]|uniref:LysR family transcriptional regulator n=1 Tax=Uliginosibacterium aquaticum TaxID=2731212 RepID=A0ABX2INU7_9RHOO|nr:LysR substrate-binding domain-containing protein [Uliginosibacterium aquaticum]NSL55961.1 LysR family transcriptional regulator [Uliginosibacterium aquaticum]
MELRHLRYFVAVAEELHFTRAAARLHIGQPPLSQQIQALEAELGVSLFHRTRRSVQLTEAGRHLLERARTILAASTDVAAELQRIARGESGELRIAFTSSGLLIPELRSALKTYRQRYPGVSLRLSEMYTHAQFAALIAGELDVGFVRYNEPAAPAGLRLQLLRRDRLCLILPDDHPLASQPRIHLADCRNEAFIGYPAGAGASLVDYLQALCRNAGFEPHITQEAREAQTQIGLVAAGIGVAVLAEPLALIRVEGVRFIPLADPGAEVCMALATRAEEASPRVQGFMNGLLPARVD